MNAKIMFSLAIFNIVILLASITLCIPGLIEFHGKFPMKCMSSVYVNSLDAKGKAENVGGIKIIFYITDEGKVTIHEYGTILYQNKEYFINRTVYMLMEKETQGGFQKFTRQNVIANPQDTIPENLVERLTTRQLERFYKINKLDQETWSISDLQRTIFICRK